MPLTLFNTLSRRAETFKPIDAGHARMYTCGPTVYNYAHIGNFRAYVFEDILRRALKYFGYQVEQVMNLTDVDDKTIRGAREAGLSLDDFTRTYKDAFFHDIDVLRIERAEHYPDATDHIKEMIAIIEALMKKEIAYLGDDGSVYYSIRKFEGYGKLARIDLEGQQSGARVKMDEYAKDEAADFALWKAYDDDDGDVAWDSPWGRGRPGWHIECSAMSMKYLGPHFDIHTGGVDNMFPHHEDEIAQSEGATGETFVNYWLHCAHLVVAGKKMSKSSGNFYTLRDLIEKDYSGREIRWLLMSAQYRQSLNFTFTGLEAGKAALQRVDDTVRRLKVAAGGESGDDEGIQKIVDAYGTAFDDAIADDLNIPQAMAALFDCIRDINRLLDQKSVGSTAIERVLDLFRAWDTIFAALDVDHDSDDAPAEIIALVAEREAARKGHDFARADEIRDQLVSEGWRLEDTPAGARVIRG